MQLFDKDGNAANCDTSQVEVLLKAGWTKEAAPVKEEAPAKVEVAKEEQKPKAQKSKG